MSKRNERWSFRKRLRAVLLAGIVGWLAGFAASTPAMAVIGWRDSEHELKLFFETIGGGLLVWGAWTMLLGAATWLFFAVPCALLLPPRLLIRHRPMVMLLTFLLTFGMVAVKLYSFQDQAASKVLLRFILYMPYGSFALLFALGTAWWYTRMLAQPYEQR